MRMHRVRLLLLTTAIVLAIVAAPLVHGGVLYSRARHFAKQTQQHNQNSTVVQRHVDAFINKRAANTTQSVELIARVPLQLFEFKYDAIVGRTQFGVLGPELKELLPDGVQIVAERVVLDHDTKQKVALRDFHVVDKDTLFMHNVGATKVLIHATNDHRHAIEALEQQIALHQQHIEELRAYLAQEASAQLVEKRRIVEAEVLRAEKLIEEAHVRGEEDRRTSQEQKTNALEVEQTKHALAQRRLEDEDLMRKQQNRDLVTLQEESNVRIELKRRETEEVLKEKQLEADRERMQLERNTSLAKAHIDVEGRIKQQRLNQDIEMAQLHQRLEADRVKLLQALQATFDNLGQGAMVLLTDKEKLTKFVGGFVLLAAGIYLSREGIRIGGKMIEQRLGKPSLVRETSRAGGLWGFIKSRLAPFFRRQRGAATHQQELKDVVLQELLETRVHEIAKSVRNAILHKAPYRHLLLYGPPGTGKTMVAKRLARSSGMDYAILSGGDVGPLGSDAVTELHALFNWARASPRGLLIFIDEAEAFLGCRATRKTHMSEAMRNALNALLYHTGTQSTHFMLVIATNRPEDLDSAVTDRIDDTLHFDLPETTERVRLLEMYFDEFVGAQMASAEPMDVVRKTLRKFGPRTDGMSGREIAKMMLYLQSVVYAQDDVTVSIKLVERVVNDKIDEHKRKLELRSYSER